MTTQHDIETLAQMIEAHDAHIQSARRINQGVEERAAKLEPGNYRTLDGRRVVIVEGLNVEIIRLKEAQS